MRNILVRIPNEGDIVFYDGNKKVGYIACDTYEASSFPKENTIVGVVAHRQGRDLIIVNPKQSDEVFAEAFMWSTSGWSLDNMKHEVTISFYSSQAKPSVPTFTYQSSDLEGVARSLRAWFDKYYGESNLRYNCYVEGGVLKIVKEKYANWYEYTLNISGISVESLTATELPAITNSYAKNGKGGYYKGMHWEKFKSYMKTTESESFNPKEPLSSMPTNPISLPSYLSAVGAFVRNIFGEGEEGWEKFLMTYMVEMPTRRGVFGEGYQDPKKNTYLLAGKRFNKTSGESAVMYPACEYCANVGYDHPSFAKGTWVLPTMVELMKIYEFVRTDSTDRINRSIRAIGGSRLTFRYLWSCCRYNVNSSWLFHGYYGSAHYLSFYLSFGVVACSLYKMSECE